MLETLVGAVKAPTRTWTLGGRSAAGTVSAHEANTLTPRGVYPLALTWVGGEPQLLAAWTRGAGVTGEDSPAPRRTFAEKLESLFRSVPGPRGEYSLEEVAAGIRARGGPTISASYIWQLRKGIKDNPTKKHMEALADWFGVPPAYFHDDEAAARVEAELATLAALRDAGVRRVALRAAGLSPQSLAAIASIIESARQVEGLRNGQELESAPSDAEEER